MKLRKQEIDRCLLKADEDLFLVVYPENLVANQRQYPLQADILSRIKRVEAKLDETNFIKLGEFDITRYDKPISTESDITTYFANLEGEAFFELLHRSIYIYSGTIVGVTNGLNIWYMKYSLEITDLGSATDMSVNPNNTTHGIPKELHELLARGVIIDYKESLEKPIPLSERESKYEFDLDKAIEAVKHGNLDREVIGDLPPASERGNDGADY